MAFLCTGDDMLYASEGQFISEAKLKIKPPKPSYTITTPISKTTTIKVDFTPTKEIYYNEKTIPNWLDITFYSIYKKDGKRITALQIKNNCLLSNNPFIPESSVILYCHENQTDLLRILPFLIDISLQMKCDIISFDYQGFGFNYNNNKAKLNIDNFFLDGEEVINFCIKFLEYKIENVIIMGKEIGAMIGIYLSSMNNYNNCRSLILINPLIISNSVINVKLMRSINCKCFLIYELERKEDKDDNDIINLCREIPNQQEWFPIKKNKKEYINKFFGFKKYLENNFDDVYMKHRSKFIIKLRDYIYPEDENIKKRKKGTSSTGESTDSDTNLNLSMNKNLNFIENNINEIKKEENNNKIKEKNDIFNADEIHIDNEDDY